MNTQIKHVGRQKRRPPFAFHSARLYNFWS